MKLEAHVGDETHAVEVRRDGRRVFARVDDREYELEVSEPETNVYLLKHEGRIYEFAAAPGGEKDAVVVTGKTGDTEMRFVDPKRLPVSGGAADHADGISEIRAAMPGKVVRMIASIGDELEKGDPVIVVEAMKMQNELKAPRSGTLKEIRVGEGATVGAGDVLAVIE